MTVPSPPWTVRFLDPKVGNDASEILAAPPRTELVLRGLPFSLAMVVVRAANDWHYRRERRKQHE